MTPIPRFESRGHLVDGVWTGLGTTTFTTQSPIDERSAVGRYDAAGLAHLERAVLAARAAQKIWRRETLERRLEVMHAFGDALAARPDTIAPLITAEMGKCITEARIEANALQAKARLTGQLAPRELAPLTPEGVDGYATWRPLGVMAVVGPFNFPVHLSNGHILPALVSGNAAILKPSETAPACAELYADCWREVAAATGAPMALLQLIQGKGDVGAALAAHSGIDAVAFTGSYAVGVAIRRATAAQTGKLLALEMGGKNTALVLEDANIGDAARVIAKAAFATTGQRCTATSRVLVAPSVADALLDALRAELPAWLPGDPFAQDTAVGPLATPGARDRFIAAQSRLDGLRTVVAGGAADIGPGCWVTPAIHEVADRSVAGDRIVEELFGPEILVERVDEPDWVERANATPYGLAMSVHTEDHSRFEALRPELEAGLVNWNRPTAGASSALPFGGLKHSGNLRPAGSMALRYCVAPVATLAPPRQGRE